MRSEGTGQTANSLSLIPTLVLLHEIKFEHYNSYDVTQQKYRRHSK